MTPSFFELEYHYDHEPAGGPKVSPGFRIFLMAVPWASRVLPTTSVPHHDRKEPPLTLVKPSVRKMTMTANAKPESKAQDKT